MARRLRRMKHSHEDNDQEGATTTQDMSSVELPIHAYVPDYLKQVVFPCHGDFCQTPLFHRRLIAQLMAEGESRIVPYICD